MLVKLSAALSAVLVAVPATAQDAAPAVPLHTPVPANVAAASGMPVHNAILRAGTSVPMRTLAELTTKGKRLKVGHRFNLEVAEPVMVDGQVVIPAGSPGVGEVTHVRNKGMWGKSGGIEARVVYVRAGDRQIRLSGQMDDKGVTGTAGVVGAVIAVPLAGFFVTGTSAVIPAGSPVTAFTEEDVPVQFAAAAPMVIPAAQPAISTTPVATPTTAQ